MRIARSIGLAAIAVTALTAQTALAGERWDMPMADAASGHQMQAAQHFARAVSACSGGRLEIVPRIGGPPGAAGGIKGAVREGRLPLGETPLAPYQHENALYAVDSLPFLAVDHGASERLYRIARPALETALGRQNLVLLYAVPGGPQGLFADRQISGLAGLKGMVLEAGEATTARLAELAGMKPEFPAAAARLLLAGAEGGYRGGPPRGLAHFHDIRAWLPRGYVVANRGAYDGLAEADRKCLHEAAGQAEALGAARARALVGWYRDRLASRGIAVHDSGKLRKELAVFGRIVQREWAAAVGPEGRAILAAYRAKE